MSDPELELRRGVLLTFQVALLGMVTPSLRGVTVGWDKRRIVGRCLFDGRVGESEVEAASEVEAEVMASFPDHEVSVTAEQLDEPAPLNSRSLTAWVYCRKE